MTETPTEITTKTHVNSLVKIVQRNEVVPEYLWNFVSRWSNLVFFFSTRKCQNMTLDSWYFSRDKSRIQPSRRTFAISSFASPRFVPCKIRSNVIWNEYLLSTGTWTNDVSEQSRYGLSFCIAVYSYRLNIRCVRKVIVSMSSNRFPLSAIFNFGNIQKSQGTMSGLYGGWRSCTILCFARNCCTRFDECAGALSWWRSQSPLDQKRGRFLLTASRNLFRTST